MNTPAATDGPSLRQAGREALSLALIDSRNRTLRLLAWFEEALAPAGSVVLPADAMPPDWAAGHAAWLAEAWIARNPQRNLGARCPADGPRLASVEPRADAWFDPRLVPAAGRSAAVRPDPATLRAYMLDTLETTLELLERAPEDDDALHFHRMALFHEDWRGEQLAALAQRVGVAVGLTVPDGGAPRPELAVPATRWRLGWAGGGFALDIERGEAEEPIPAFEIDAQPVTWAQYLEFIDDGGYDEPQVWHPQGWQWLQAQAAQEGRRGPRYVDQVGGGAVLCTRFGRAVRAAVTQPVLHVTWWEADAFARWAGRRLPAEAEWEIAAQVAARRGFAWGAVREWTAGTVRPWAGWHPEPWTAQAELDASGVFGIARVLRGASFATPPRMRHPKARAWALPDDDEGFVGFRTCAV